MEDTLENLELLGDAEEEKLEQIAATCITEGVKAKKSNDIVTAIGSFQIAWAIARYTENIALMDFSTDLLVDAGIPEEFLNSWRNDGYEVLINSGMIYELLKYKLNEAA